MEVVEVKGRNDMIATYSGKICYSGVGRTKNDSKISGLKN